MILTIRKAKKHNVTRLGHKQKSQRMRTFTAEYPQKVNGCGLSQLNTPKKSTDADFHKRIKTVVPNFGNT